MGRLDLFIDGHYANCLSENVSLRFIKACFKGGKFCAKFSFLFFLLIQHGVLALEKFECFVILSFHSFDFAIFL